jgi:tetrapyrrole methylase family protein/MazG family protein
VIDRLLAPDGCPWDREQNHVTLKKCLLEETYEVLEAIDEGDMAQLREELGDVLLQVAFHAALADRRGDFDLNEVVEEVTAKMIRRHPHVFGEVEVKSSTDVLINWEKIKKGEKGHNGSQGKMMDSVNKALPALLMAEEVQKKAKKVGFDWSEIKDPLAKVLEEYNELRELLNIQDQADQANGRGKNREGRINEEPKQRRDEAEDELGDLLFAVVNVARFLGVSAEAALFKAVRKFMRRFSYIEKEIAEKSLKWEDMDINSLDIIWERAKSEGL